MSRAKIRNLFDLVRGHYEWEAHEVDQWRELAFGASGQVPPGKLRAETAEQYSLEWSNKLERLLEPLRWRRWPEEKPDRNGWYLLVVRNGEDEDYYAVRWYANGQWGGMDDGGYYGTIYWRELPELSEEDIEDY